MVALVNSESPKFSITSRNSLRKPSFAKKAKKVAELKGSANRVSSFEIRVD